MCQSITKTSLFMKTREKKNEILHWNTIPDYFNYIKIDLKFDPFLLFLIFYRNACYMTLYILQSYEPG